MSQDWEAGRLDSDLDGVGFDTLAVRAGQHRGPEGEHGEAMFLTSSYVFRSAADAAARFAGEVPGNAADGRKLAAAAGYDLGPLRFALAGERVNGTSNAAGARSVTRVYHAAAAYKVVKDLDLKIGTEVLALVKSTEVSIAKL